MEVWIYRHDFGVGDGGQVDGLGDVNATGVNHEL